LQESGFAAVKPTDLLRLARSCDRHWRDTGDARYYILGATLSDLWTWWRAHDESGGVPIDLATQIESRLMSGVDSITRATDAREGATLASELREDLKTMRARW
jgi:hypothetical protein